MSKSIYLIKENQSLKQIIQSDFEKERDFQQLLIDYPALLTGDEFSADEPRRWVLISDEMPIAEDEYTKRTWSLDHLFIDQDGIPTLVEVKRSCDSRLRREVAGQMLDYASNAYVYWTLDRLKACYEKSAMKHGFNGEEELLKLLNDENEDLEEFWNLVEKNLQSGNIRLVFVADMIPLELQRIIEFMNEQMDPAQVLGVELRKFVTGNEHILVPRVVGLTAGKILKKKSESKTIKCTEDMMLKHLESIKSPYIDTIKGIMAWGKQAKLSFYWSNTIENSGQFGFVLSHKSSPDRKTWKHLFKVEAQGSITLYLKALSDRGLFEDADLRNNYGLMLKEIFGFELTDENLQRRPRVSLSKLAAPAKLEQFLESSKSLYAMETQVA